MKVRVGLIGLGGVADRIHLPACKAIPEIEVVGGCDPNPGARRAMAAKYGVPRTFETCDELLEKMRPEMVIIGSPPSSHFELCSKALEAGAHVLCEKPFMETLDEADRIIELARTRNLLLRVNNQYRYMTFYAETRRRLERGDFGNLFYIQCWQQMYHPPEKETNWRSQLKNYVLYEFATHALDLVSFFFDALPESVTANIPRVLPRYDADVLVHTVLRFPNERLAALSFNRVTHAPERYLEMRLDCEKASVRISLGGVARVSVDWCKSAGRPILRAAYLRGGQAVAEVNGVPRRFASAREREFASATTTHLRRFLAEMREPHPPLDAALHARGILGVVFAGYESARRGETVRLDSSRVFA